MSDFILDKDPFIPTGEPATPQDVAAMIVDPDSPVTADTVALLAPEQRPTLEDVVAAVDASDVVAVKGEDPAKVAAQIVGKAELAEWA